MGSALLQHLHLQLMWCSQMKGSLLECCSVLELRGLYLDGVEFNCQDVALFNTLVSVCEQGFRYSVAFNSTTVHSLPMAVNILSNALLKGLNGTKPIRTWTKPFDYVSICYLSYLSCFPCAILNKLNVSIVTSLSKSRMPRPTLWFT